MYGVPAMITADVLFMRKFPNWGLFRRFWAGTAAGLPLMFVGLAHRSILHYDFSVSLENPLGFARALENVPHRFLHAFRRGLGGGMLTGANRHR